MSSSLLKPSADDLAANFALRHGDVETTGWQPRMRQKFGYFTPDEVYEALLTKLVTDGCDWLDVGCGRALFPSNPALGERLAGRCGHLTGVDPDETIEEHPHLHEKVRASIADFEPQRQYDLITLRMVAEHVDDPEACVAKLRSCLKPKGHIVVYTVNRWSPVPLATRAVPMAVRHPIKKAVWGTDEKDTFPTRFKMNTRGRLRELFDAAGMEEEFFEKLDDTRSTLRYRVPCFLELCAWKAFHTVGLRYPENCLLGVYRVRPEKPSGNPLARIRNGPDERATRT